MRQLGVIAAALLILMAGFCVFAYDQAGVDCQAMAPDLCAGTLASSLALALLSGLLLVGRLLLDPVRSAYAVSLHIPDPPPKSSLS